MSRFGLMADRVLDPAAIPVLVDLGYVDDKPARNCAERLMAAGVARTNFSVEGAGRLLVKLPPRKAEALIRRFRFAAESTYWQCTHCRAALATLSRSPIEASDKEEAGSHSPDQTNDDRGE